MFHNPPGPKWVFMDSLAKQKWVLRTRQTWPNFHKTQANKPIPHDHLPSTRAISCQIAHNSKPQDLPLFHSIYTNVCSPVNSTTTSQLTQFHLQVSSFEINYCFFFVFHPLTKFL